MPSNTDTDDDGEQYPTEPAPRNLMRERNPDTWDPDAPADAGKVNLDVSGTVGPDYLGQQTVDVDGHRFDRDVDMDEDHARRLALRGEFDDLDDDQPLPLLASSMRTDPIEGTQGSYRHVIELDEPCPGCGGDWGVHICASTLGGVHMETCLLCEYEITQP